MRTISRIIAFATCVCVWSQSIAGAAEVRLGNMKADKILFLGNSITAVPQRDLPTWWGLSASTVAKDYVHLLVGALDAKTGGHLTLLPTTAHVTHPINGTTGPCDSNVINVADVFERSYDSYDASKITKQLAWKADIVILQFGENIPPATFNAESFKAGMKKLVADLKESSNPHIFVASHILGANPAVDEIKRSICAEDPTQRVFVDLSSVAKDPANMGAYAHPNDKGMALIADAIFQAITAHAAATASASSEASQPAAKAGK